jgi:CheY-like chemotaxis protein
LFYISAVTRGNGVLKKMQHVLIVDDSAEILKVLLATFKSYSHKFKTLAAKNGKEATQIISKQKIDLVVTDIQMPVMDGLELIAFIKARYPEMPIFVIAGALTPEVDEVVSGSDSMKFFSKPLSPKILAENVFEELVKNAGGEMHGVSIPSFLQLMEMEKRSCTLVIRDGENNGQLFLKKGIPVDAQTGELSGEAAACEIISWDKATVQVRGGRVHEENVIETPLMALIIEATRLKDERINSAKEENSTETISESTISAEDPADDDALERQKAKLPPGLIDILSSADEVDEYRIFNEDNFVLNKSETVDSDLKVVPSDYFKLADPLTNQIVSGDMSYFQINTSKGTRYIFLKYHDTRLVLSVKPEFRPESLFKTMREFSPNMQAGA